MPTKQPRINVTVSDHQHAVLMELAKLQNRSASSFLVELLNAAMPTFEKTIPLYRAVAEQAERQPAALQNAVAKLDLNPEVDGLDQYDFLEEVAKNMDVTVPSDRS